MPELIIRTIQLWLKVNALQPFIMNHISCPLLLDIWPFNYQVRNRMQQILWTDMIWSKYAVQFPFFKAKYLHTIITATSSESLSIT